VGFNHQIERVHNAAVFGRANDWLARYGDLVLAAAVAGIVSTLVLRIPTVLMDGLIGINLSVSLLILFIALYAPSPARFGSFPTIILLSTLFRLTLNVATTKLILLQADAGHIIYAFGNFVVGGNLIVGAVVFLVLTVIQFIVIAKGADRAGEVAARFTLDAMPGKQNAIDADVSQGRIKPDEARQKRADLDREGSLYGALDGAMKFVKGDAVAGLIVVAVNIIGGIAVGMTQMGMTLAESANTFGVLTIGDGLVSQIPALLISIGAGLVITRVDSGADAESAAALEIKREVLAYPRALWALSVFLLAVAFVPGFPKPVLLTIAVVFAGLGFVASRATATARAASGTENTSADEAQKPSAPAPAGPARIPLRLRCPNLLMAFFDPADPAQSAAAKEKLRLVRDLAGAQMGFPFPPLSVVRADPRRYPLAPTSFALTHGETQLAVRSIPPSGSIVPLPAAQLRAKGLDAAPLAPPGSQRRGEWSLLAKPEDAERARELNLPVGTSAEYTVRQLVELLCQHAHEIFGVQDAAEMVDRLRQTDQELVDAVVPTGFSVAEIADVCTRLLRERIPLENPRLILEALARWRRKAKPREDVVEHVRTHLRKVVSRAAASDSQLISYLAVDPDLEDLITRSTRLTEDGLLLGLPEPDARKIRDCLARALEARERPGDPVLLASPTVRAGLREIIADEFPTIHVLKRSELAAGYRTDPAGVLTLDTTPAA
jgi:type III secretion protein V